MNDPSKLCTHLASSVRVWLNRKLKSTGVVEGSVQAAFAHWLADAACKSIRRSDAAVVTVLEDLLPVILEAGEEDLLGRKPVILGVFDDRFVGLTLRGVSVIDLETGETVESVPGPPAYTDATNLHRLHVLRSSPCRPDKP